MRQDQMRKADKADKAGKAGKAGRLAYYTAFCRPVGGRSRSIHFIV